MSDDIIPYNYTSWHHCITVDCKIELTAGFVQQRIRALEDSKDFRTQQFVKLYGEPHRKNVLVWFKQAQQSL